MNTFRGTRAASIVGIILLASFAAIPASAATAAPFQFSRNLQLWETGPDVLLLQQFLNAQGFFVAQTGPGSPGKETTLFGTLSYRALTRYQEAHDLPATGFFGPLTRKVIAFSSSAGGTPTNTSANSSGPSQQTGISNAQSPTATSSQKSTPLSLPATSLTFGGGGEGGGGGGGGGSSNITPADTTPPVSSAGSPSGTLALNTTSTTLSLTTDEAATCKYSTSSGTAYGSMTPFTTTGGTSHSTSITSLTNGGSYIYYIKCQDSSGNTDASDYTISFTVAADTTSPTVVVTAPSNNSTVTGSSATLSANATDDVSVAGVQFKLDTNTNIGAEDTSSPYSVNWDSTGVADGTHTIIAVARDGSGNYATSSVITVTVDNTAPVISAISSGSPSVSTSTITWTTDENANSKVVYGPTTAYGSASSSASLGTSHSIGLTGLTASTLYHYAIVSADSAGNTATSSDQTFTTAATPDTTPPTAPTNLTAVAASLSELYLSWTASTDNVGVAGYKIFRAGSQVGTTTSGTIYADTGLTASTTYTYTVKAYDAAGNISTASNVGTSTTGVWADGFASAPAGTSQYPTLLNGYVARAPWRVAGVDYPVGYPAGTTLKDPATATLPSGVSRDSTNHVFNVSGNNVTLDGWDFSLENGWLIVPGNGVSGLTISNSNFKLGSNRNPFIWPEGNITNGMTVSNNVFDGNSVPIKMTTSASSATSTNVLNLTNTTGIVVGMAVGDISTANAVSTSNNAGGNETRVQSIVPNTSVTLALNTIGTVNAGDTISFQWTAQFDVPIIAGVIDAGTTTVQYNWFKNAEDEDWQQAATSTGGQLNMSYNLFENTSYGQETLGSHGDTVQEFGSSGNFAGLNFGFNTMLQNTNAAASLGLNIVASGQYGATIGPVVVQNNTAVYSATPAQNAYGFTSINPTWAQAVTLNGNYADTTGMLYGWYCAIAGCGGGTGPYSTTPVVTGNFDMKTGATLPSNGTLP